MIWVIIVRDRMTDETNVYFEAFKTRAEATNTAREIEAEDEMMLATLRPVIISKMPKTTESSNN